ncbi:MAG: HipA domain-containing protein, partial [Synergistaceae bacterium]|nr:HipA domain-containing protein [Synergistaceae bacterium]
GGSSGGARPKILTTCGDEDWIVKFPAATDSVSIGEEEYLYSLCAKECGVDMPVTRLFPSKRCPGYFGVKRFDRVDGEFGRKKRVHTLSASAILETSHRVPNLDYLQLMKLTLKLTNDFDQVGKMYSLMCFNVFAHNRDDHSKNFSYVFDDEAWAWKMSPTYDLTYSSSIGGEHATSVNGNGKDPGMKEILAVAEAAGLNKNWARTTADEIQGKVNVMLGDI